MDVSNTTAKSTVAAILLAAGLVAAAAPASARMIANPSPDEGGGQGSPTIAYTHPPAGFVWSAPSRMEGWVGAWRQRGTSRSWPEETYKPGYVNPTSWNLTMMGCQTENDYLYNIDPDAYELAQEEFPDQFPGPQYLYRWQYNGKDTGMSNDCYGMLEFPAEGYYQVTLTVKNPETNNVQTWTHTVEVKDFLVVVLGDSSASGEGAPDQPLNQSSNGRANWVDNRCHRSKHAGGAVAARRIENGDSKSSVTFLSFACSGATLATDIYDNSLPDPYEQTTSYPHRGVGITAPYAGIEPIKYPAGSPWAGEPDFSYKLPSQVDQLWNALTDFGAHQPRKIDALIVAGGINDARFADLAAICTLFNFCDTDVVQVGHITTGLQSLDEQFHDDAARIPGGWATLANQLIQRRPLKDGTLSGPITATKKLALQYPPFFTDDDGERCVLPILDDALPWWVHFLHAVLYPVFPLNLVPPGWYIEEIEHADTVWAPHLNSKVREGSIAAGFEFVDTIANRFFKHGICADDRYINTPTDSAERQGDADGRDSYTAGMSSKGSAHPNYDGYEAYADEILRHLNVMTKKVDGNSPPVAFADKVTAAKGLPQDFNVLTNDTDADALDTLAATIATQPNHGTLEMKLDGSTKYKPKPGYIGTDSFSYSVTDGTDTTTGFVFITVIDAIKVGPRIIGGEITRIGGLDGGYPLAAPYRIAFDKEIPDKFGNVYFDKDTGELQVSPPPLRQRRFRVRYTMYSDTTDVHSPSYGESVVGWLRLRVRTPRD